jgi:uncharacterized protein YndB with AHSA1/START domain
MTNTIRKELVVPQSQEVVWLAITDSSTLAEWMFPNDFRPIVGHEFTFQVPPNPAVKFEGLTVRCQVLECEPPNQLVFSWSAAELSKSQVSFRLEPAGEGTRILLEHSGFDISLPWGEQAYKGAEYGWAKMVKQLQATLERPERACK